MLTRTHFSAEELVNFSETEVQLLDKGELESKSNELWTPAVFTGKAPSNTPLIIGSTTVLLLTVLGFVITCMATLGGHVGALEKVISHFIGG